MGFGVVGGTRLHVPGAEHRADQRAAAQIKPKQRLGHGVGADLAIQREDLGAELGSTQSRAFEHEKRNLLGRIEQAQLRGEFEAVDDLRLVAEQDVLGSEITMRIDDMPVRAASLDRRGVGGEESELPRDDVADGAGVDAELRREELVTIGLEPAFEVPSIIAAVPGRPGRARVKRGELDEQPAQLCGLDPAGDRERIEHVPARQAVHFDEPVDGLPVRVALEREAPRRAEQRHDSDIDGFGKPAVQRNFELAGDPPCFEIREVDLVETNRLLELVDETAREKQAGEMRLDELDPSGAVGKAFGTQQVLDFLRERDLGIRRHLPILDSKDAPRVYVAPAFSRSAVALHTRLTMRFGSRDRGRVFADRQEAGRELGRRFRETPPSGEPIVLGLPRGGVPVAFEIAAALDAPLDVFLVRKIGAPYNPEFAAGAIAAGGIVVYNDEALLMLGLDQSDLEPIIARERAELERRERVYRQGRAPLELEAKTVIVCDDGIATGSTMRAAVDAVRTQRPKRIIVAAPTASREAVAMLERSADTLVILSVPEPYVAVGRWYEYFPQLEDAEVVALLAAHEKQRARESSE